MCFWQCNSYKIDRNHMTRIVNEFINAANMYFLPMWQSIVSSCYFFLLGMVSIPHCLYIFCKKGMVFSNGIVLWYICCLSWNCVCCLKEYFAQSMHARFLHYNSSKQFEQLSYCSIKTLFCPSTDLNSCWRKVTINNI